jgi:hypothetical protein
MSFATDLRFVAGQLSAAACAEAVSPILSRRVVENWIAGRNEPPDWAKAWILTRIKRARARHERKQARAMQAPNKADMPPRAP